MENAKPEPSMEEILASIRRIISEDESDDSAKPAPPAPARKPELTLTPAAVASSQPQVQKPAPQQPEPPAKPAEEAAMPSQDLETLNKNVADAMADDAAEEILDHSTAAVASKAFQTLSQSVRISEGPGRTLEDLVTEMLRPMVKEWLNSNLPAIVEEKVEEEVQRVARRRRG